jgi:hypothetical protein
MSYMNSLIKLGVLLFNIFLFICGFAIILVSLLIYTETWPEFERETYATWCYWGFTFGAAAMFITCLGCIGAANQVQRDGCCPGRCVLGYYQLMLIGNITAFVFIGVYLSSTLSSVQYTLDNDGNTEYDQFEEEISTRFNSNYFAALCSEFPENTWFLKWTGGICPDTMSLGNCALSTNDIEPLSTREECSSATQCLFSPFNPNKCCPDEQACTDETWGRASCPYEQCRSETLQWFVDKLDPFVSFCVIVTYISIGMMFLTCLLICYNPKDSVEKELVKTGVLVQVAKRPEPRRKTVQQEQGRRGNQPQRNNGPGSRRPQSHQRV